jgi:ribosome-interacting GTPase 1
MEKMPANLPPQYFAAEKRWREATTIEDQIGALREMLSIMPKHKGTDKLQADLKRRIAKLHREAKEQHKKGGHRVQLGYVPKEGAGQVAVIGPPNVGKSALVRAMTHAHPDVAPYPFTTQKPGPAMMPYEDIQIQLVDTPPLSDTYLVPWLPNLIRLADLALLVVDLGCDPVGQAQMVIDQMRKTSTHLDARGGESDGQVPIVLVKTMIVGNKSDLPQAAENFQRLQEKLSHDFQMVAISAGKLEGLEGFKIKVFEALEIIRVYTKEPGKKPDLEQPYVLKRGSTVVDVAAAVHRDFAKTLKHARIWGSAKYGGQNVQRDHQVEDGDIIELHI